MRVLFIMGVAATCVAWHTQIQALLARSTALGRPIQILAYDNRGVGRSSCPKDRRHYSSSTMARDAAALMSHLGFGSAHVVGFSMGTQIAGARPGRACAHSVSEGGGWRSGVHTRTAGRMPGSPVVWGGRCACSFVGAADRATKRCGRCHRCRPRA